MRTPLLAANWKMHKTERDVRAFIAECAPLITKLSNVEVVIAPAFTGISAAVDAVKAMPGSKISIAGQDLYFERQGAFTGEVSAEMLKDAGASHVIIGHSERRRLFGDTDDAVNKKLRAAITGSLTPIVCIGETLAEREAGDTLTVLDRQVKVGLDGLTGDELAALVIAYEPVWAIGTGTNATTAEAGEAHAHIRSRLRQWFGGAPADQCRILYGGSVKPENIRELIGLTDVDGALVGGASLEARRFAEIIARTCA